MIYLFNTRTTGGKVGSTSQARYALATIRTDVNSGVNGIILFPDGVNFESTEFTTLGTVNSSSAWATKCASTQWTALEGKGCVFLPAAGKRVGTNVIDAEEIGDYWSSSPHTSGESGARYVDISSNGLSLAWYTNRFNGFSVRLVRLAEWRMPRDRYLAGLTDDRTRTVA